MRIAICGIRGIPACYGGFETFAEQLSARLVARGHSVTVYGRKHCITHSEPTYRGVCIRLLWAPRHKYFETPVHTLLCLLHIVWRRFVNGDRFDVLLVCNAANSPWLFLQKLFGPPVAVNVDGIERLRGKWNWLGRTWYLLGERCSVWFADRVISDAQVIRKYYQEQYGTDSEVIAYGFQSAPPDLIETKLSGAHTDSVKAFSEEPIFAQLGIHPNAYLLYVSRLEPENNAHVVVKAHARIQGDKLPLVVVGDAPYAKSYIEHVRHLAGEQVIFAGYQFGTTYEALQLGAYCYVQATEVGGTHPALVESMGFGNCIIANDTPENREVLDNAGLYYRKNDPQSLAECLERVLRDRDEVLRLRQAAFRRARQHYDWDGIVTKYEHLFRRLATSRSSKVA